jgi:prepilin signal peptidase PulO-like enzyme (type II secretory pathway)
VISSGFAAEAAVGSALLGLAVGWFLDTVIVRWATRGQEQESVPAKRRSRTWLVIAVAAAGFVLAYVQFETIWQLVFAWWFIAVMILITFIDLEQMRVPDRIVLPSALVGLAGAIALEPEKWWVYVAAAVGASLFLFLLALVWRGGMGAGDVKMALLMGAALGALVVVALFLAFALGAVIGILLMATKRKTRHDVIPFGPYLALGSVLALLFGREMVDWYVGLLP